MENWQIAILVLTAVFVGMWIPVSLQLLLTLRAGQRFIVDLGNRSKKGLSELSEATAGLNKTMAEVEDIAQTAGQLKDSFRVVASIGAAVGPAVAALVRAMREPAATAGGNGVGPGIAPSTPPQKESTT